jgi:hypothetical protein
MIIHRELVRFSFKTDSTLNKRLVHQIRAWNYYLPVPNERIALYIVLWQRIKPLSYQIQNAILKEIKSWAGVQEAPSGNGETMDIREMQMLSQNPLFSIGAHSVHHAMLAEQNVADQAFEVKESKRQIENL